MKAVVLLFVAALAGAPATESLPAPQAIERLNQELLPGFAYGAVCFRRTNPSAEDRAPDYRTAAEDGHTTFRHRFCRSAIEGAPGVYSWSDYDRQLDVADDNGVTTIIAEILVRTERVESILLVTEGLTPEERMLTGAEVVDDLGEAVARGRALSRPRTRVHPRRALRRSVVSPRT